MTLTDKLRQAVAHHQQGHLDQAALLYREVLAQSADNFDALHLYGVLETQLGRHDEAAALIQRAIEVDPGHAAAHSNLGLVFQHRGEYEQALAQFDRALSLRPDHGGALYNRGNALRALGRPEDAVESYERALAQSPALADAWINHGKTLRELGKPLEALASFDRALALKPDDAGVHFNRGRLLLELDRAAEAVPSYERALARQPDDADLWFHRGNALIRLGRRADAVASYRRALELEPQCLDAINNLGVALMQLGRHEEALASFDRALAVRPDAIEALSNRGNVLQEMKRYAEASGALAQLVALAPDYAYASGRLLECRLHCCAWTRFADDAERLEHSVAAGGRSIAPFAFLAVSQSAALQLECARRFVADKFPPAAGPLWAGERYRHDRIRLAYVSADFREHPLTHLMMDLFERHDRTRFETIAVSFGEGAADAVRLRLERSFDRFIDCAGRSDAETAALLRQMEIDIAVDLNGFTAGGRTGVFALRPAPVQVSYLGFPGTMGADYIDYILADPFVIPEAGQGCYAERVVRLPDTFQANVQASAQANVQPNDGERRIGPRPSRDEAGLPGSAFVFCCFNTNYKITPAIFDVWMRLLHRVSTGVLWLQGGNPSVEVNLRREAATRGIDPGRLVFAPRLSYDEHLARAGLADLFLDTLPFNAGATASDMLRAGLPVLTCAGDAFAARMAGSVLHAAGLPELVTHSLDEYESQAVRLATGEGLLGALKARLAGNRDSSALFDGERFRRHIEAAYVAMWERCERGEPPADFAVVPIPRS